MPTACVLLAPGFEEIEAVTIIDVLRRADVATKVLGVGAEQVEGAHGIAIRADALLSDCADEAFDAVVLPGGLPGAENLRDDDAVQALLKKQQASGGILAAICAGPIALSAAGVLEGKAATSYPGFGAQLKCGEYREEKVVIDGNVITSRGPGTALPFALALVSALVGEEASSKLGERMLSAA